MQRVAVGIDLGTTISMASIVNQQGQPIPVRGKSRNHLIPSAIFFGDTVIVGEAASELGVRDPHGFAEAFKRDIGKSHYSRQIRSQMVPPEVLSAYLIRHLISNCRDEWGDIGDAVITVPAYFDEKKRTATQQAAQLAGITAIDIINEPTAAAIAAGYESMRQGKNSGAKPRRLLVYDLGGGTFDVTLLEFSDRTFRALATDGEYQLGGRDFDACIANIVADQFAKKHGIDPRGDLTAAHRLSKMSRELKHVLTENESVPARFEFAGLRVEFALSRAEFEEAIEPLIERSMVTAEQVLRKASLSFNDLDEFLLVGGSSRIPLIARKASACWGKPVRLARNPDELVAHGAALYAATMRNDLLDANSKFDIVNVNAHSLGVFGIDVETQTKVNKILIPRNTKLPTSAARIFKTFRDKQPSVKVRLLEGESENPEFCTTLVDCVVRLEPPVPKDSKVEVICTYAANGTISVSARLPDVNKERSVELRRTGLSALEPLDVWTARLTQGEEVRSTDILDRLTTTTPLSNTPLDSQAKAPDQLARLDAIYRFVGKMSLDSTPPVGAIQTHRLAGLVTNEAKTIKHLIDLVEQRYHRADDFQERMSLSAHLTQLKIAWEHAIQLLLHLRVSLGREFVAENRVPPNASLFLEEARVLHSKLQGL